MLPLARRFARLHKGRPWTVFASSRLSSWPGSRVPSWATSLCSIIPFLLRRDSARSFSASSLESKGLYLLPVLKLARLMVPLLQIPGAVPLLLPRLSWSLRVSRPRPFVVDISGSFVGNGHGNSVSSSPHISFQLSATDVDYLLPYCYSLLAYFRSSVPGVSRAYLIIQ